MKLKPALVLVFAALMATSTLSLSVAPAFAQTPIDDDPLDDHSKKRLDRMEKVVRELRSIVFQGRDTGKPVMVQPAETDQQMQDLSEKVSDLEQSLTRLTSTNETLGHDLDTARKSLAQSRDENAALAQRLAALEKRLSDMEASQTQAQAQAASTQQAEAAVSEAGNPDTAFAAAKGFLDSGDYDRSESAFAAFVNRYGDSPKAPEANYWLGKTLSVRNANDEAARAYISAIRGWPRTSWAPDAVVELARSLVALNKPTDACQLLDQLTRYYPKPSGPVTAQAAKVRLQAKCAA